MSDEGLCQEPKACRERYWSEADDQEKIRRLRRAVKRLESDVSVLLKFLRYLQSHSHTQDGSVVIPMFMKDEMRGSIGRPSDGDDVYF